MEKTTLGGKAHLYAPQNNKSILVDPFYITPE